MDLETVKQQMRAMKGKVRAARKNAEQNGQLRQYQASAARLWRKVKQLSPKVAADKSE